MRFAEDVWVATCRPGVDPVMTSGTAIASDLGWPRASTRVLLSDPLERPGDSVDNDVYTHVVPLDEVPVESLTRLLTMTG
jgi:hypothetical protein